MKTNNSNLGEFIKITDNEKIYYGGFQDSLRLKGVSKYHRDRSCVVTAFTNVYLYMYKKDRKFTLEEFNDYQYWFYKILRPKISGIPTARFLNHKLKKLEKDYHINLKANYLEENLLLRKPIEKKANFISEALEKGSPVILFNWAGNKVKVLNHHAVTITGIEKNDNDVLLTASSWGRKYEISLKEFSKQMTTYSTFLYFERLDK